MNKVFKKAILVGFLFVLGGIISFYLFSSDEVLVIENEFLITFVGVVLGISATIVTFIFSATDKIWKVIDETFADKNKAQEVQRIFKNGYRELIEDSTFIFIIFILLIICILFSTIDIPFISFPATISKLDVLNAVKVGLFLNCLFATCDLFFSLSNILKLVLYENG